MNIKKYSGVFVVVGVVAGFAWTLWVTLLRALRLPNDWAEAHWLINYVEFGFIKRGLPGTLLYPFLASARTPEAAMSLIHTVATVLLLVFTGVLLYLCFRIAKKNQWHDRSILVVLVFLTSPYVVMSAHLNGYFDNILVLITVLSCLCLIKGRTGVAALLLALGVMVHETLVLVGLPSVLFLACLLGVKPGKSFPQLVFPLLVLPLGAFAAIFANHLLLLDPAILQQEIAAYLSHFEFVSDNLRQFISTSFTVSFAEYYASMSGRFWLRLFWGDFLFKTGAPVLLLLFFCWQRLRSIPHRQVLFCLLVMITLLPLSLHVIAWDSSRIWTYPLVVVMLAVWGLGEAVPAADGAEKVSPLFLVLSVALILYQLFSQIILMDYAVEQFSTVWRAILYAPLLLWLGGMLFRHLSPAKM